MGYGSVTSRQFETISNVVRGRVIHDLGAGDCHLAFQLLLMGAAHVIAVDKEIPIAMIAALGKDVALQKRLSCHIDSFEKYSMTTPDVDVAFVSWPANNVREAGLINLIKRAKTVIYLGSNSDFNQCGGPQLFMHLARRELLHYIPDVKNTLVIVGDVLRSPRESTGEEMAGLDAWNGGPALTFSQVQEFDSRRRT